MTDLWTDERSDTGRATTFDGASQQLQYHRVFGGQLLGQSSVPRNWSSIGARPQLWPRRRPHRGGTLVASYAQEALLRFRDGAE